MQQVKLPLGSTVIVLQKLQGGVWREAGRTGTCPTPEWLRERYGEAEFELRLKRGNRVVCMVAVDVRKGTRTPNAAQPSSPQANRPSTNAPVVNTQRPNSRRANAASPTP